MTDQLRVGIIGVGWGSLVQVPAFRAAGGYEVAALCSRRAERAAEAGARLGIEDASTDWEQFVRRPDLDIISVCTPTDLHREQVLGAIGAGKHVLCEKPVALAPGQGGGRSWRSGGRSATACSARPISRGSPSRRTTFTPAAR